MKKILILVLGIFLITGCTKFHSLENKLESTYNLEFSDRFINERITTFDTNQRIDIKGSIDRHLKVVGERNRYGWNWETPYLSVMIDSRRVLITQKQ